MAAALGFPFTVAQWKELERQAMVYKYMVASLPVPPDLLIPVNTRNFSDPSVPCEIFLTPRISIYFHFCLFRVFAGWGYIYFGCNFGE